MGSTDVTRTGIQCQNWTSQEPHSHSYDDPEDFNTPTVEEHRNYCRHPKVGGDWATAPWCYTMDENIRWDFCEIPLCRK